MMGSLCHFIRVIRYLSWLRLYSILKFLNSYLDGELLRNNGLQKRRTWIHFLHARERRKGFFRNLLENPKQILWRFLITVRHKFHFKILFFHLFELRIKSLNTFQNRKIILWICLLEISKSLQIKSSKFKILSRIPPCSLHQNLWRHESNSEFYEFSSQLNSNRHF